jgi:DNA invertase Pin-like site-specific DNA recombinase
MTLEDFILDQFGTKELAARRLKVSRFTIYRWLAHPGNIQLRYYKRLADITETNIDTLISYGLKDRPPLKRAPQR